MYQHDKHFTLDEAEKMLPWIIERVEKITVLFEELKNRGFDIVNKTWTPAGNGHQGRPPPDEYNEFLELIAQIDNEDVILRNFRKGVIDFPHLRSDGEEVYLCWIYGEDKIEHWHRIPDRFMDRQKLQT